MVLGRSGPTRGTVRESVGSAGWRMHVRCGNMAKTLQTRHLNERRVNMRRAECSMYRDRWRERFGGVTKKKRESHRQRFSHSVQRGLRAMQSILLTLHRHCPHRPAHRPAGI